MIVLMKYLQIHEKKMNKKNVFTLKYLLIAKIVDEILDVDYFGIDLMNEKEKKKLCNAIFIESKL